MKTTTALLMIFMLLFVTVSHADVRKNTLLNTMENQYAMVFFFRSDCPWCHQFAPTLRRFTQNNNLFTYAFSLDGKGMPGYEVPMPATLDISALFFSHPQNVTVPATFLINVNTQKFVKVSIGAVSEAQLAQSVNNIFGDASVMAALQ